MMVSVVTPVLDERESLAPLIEEIAATLGDCDFEVVAVDDGSTDGSWEELRRLKREYGFLQPVALDRHAGQSAALLAGFELARGAIVVTLDADGQNDPAEIPMLVEQLQQHPEWIAVVGYRKPRADSGWKRLQSRIANAVRNWLTGDSVRDTGCSLRAMRREALQGLPRFAGMHRFLPTLMRMQGGVVVEVPVTHRRRTGGKSKYGMWDRVFAALRDALGVRWLGRRRLVFQIKQGTE
jgi:glycosyltransferase involved in cell wall biosynthesis